MAVLIEANSVVIRLETIAEKYPGGVDQYIKDCPDGTLCKDDSIVRVGFMSPFDTGAFIEDLKRLGFKYIEDEEFVEIAVVLQFIGLLRPCNWLEIVSVKIFKGNMKLSMCQIKGGALEYVDLPHGWSYENSLSKSNRFFTSETMDKRMIFLDHTDGVDAYLDVLTGEQHFITRTSRRKANS